jgi:hypothetical protein
MTESMKELGASGHVPKQLRDPSPEELESPRFNAIWNAIKAWDIQRQSGEGYARATGADVCTILDAVDAPRPTFEQWWNHNGHGWEHGRAEYNLAKLAYGERVVVPQKTLECRCWCGKECGCPCHDAVDAQPEDGDGSRHMQDAEIARVRQQAIEECAKLASYHSSNCARVIRALAKEEAPHADH